MRDSLLTRQQLVMYLSEHNGNRVQAAKSAGVSVMFLKTKAKQYRVKTPDARKRLQQGDIFLMRSLRGLGAPVGRLSAMFNVHRNTVTAVCRYHRMS